MPGGSVYNDRFGGRYVLGSSVPTSEQAPKWNAAATNLRFGTVPSSLVNWILNTSTLGTDTRLL